MYLVNLRSRKEIRLHGNPKGIFTRKDYTGSFGELASTNLVVNVG